MQYSLFDLSYVITGATTLLSYGERFIFACHVKLNRLVHLANIISLHTSKMLLVHSMTMIRHHAINRNVGQTLYSR